MIWNSPNVMVEWSSLRELKPNWVFEYYGKENQPSLQALRPYVKVILIICYAVFYIYELWTILL
jgi:hypothetical protein